MSTPYEARVAQLEGEGMTTSDAQGVADVEFAQRAALPMLDMLRELVRRYAPPAGEAGSPVWATARARIARAEGRV